MIDLAPNLNDLEYVLKVVKHLPANISIIVQR